MTDPYTTMVTCLREAREQWVRANEAPSDDDERDAASNMADAIGDALSLLASPPDTDTVTGLATSRELSVALLKDALNQLGAASTRVERDMAMIRIVDLIRQDVLPILSWWPPRPVMDNVGDLAAAEALNRALSELNRVDPENVAGAGALYAGDNTASVRRGAEGELSPYAHVQAALMVPLTRLAGSVERAEELLYHLADNGESVEYNLRLAREEWARQDAATDPVIVAIHSLYGAADSTATVESEYRAAVNLLDKLVGKAGLSWVHVQCGELCGENSVTTSSV